MKAWVLTGKCRCECGPTCKGKCDLPYLECIEKHWKKDCDHKFEGWVEQEFGGTTVCTKCGLTASAHDFAVGP